MKNRFPNLPAEASQIATKITEVADRAEEQLARLQQIRIQQFEARLISNMIKAGAFAEYSG